MLQLPNIHSPQLQILLYPRTELIRKPPRLLLFLYLPPKLTIPISHLQPLSLHLLSLSLHHLLLPHCPLLNLPYSVPVPLQLLCLLLVLHIIEEELGEIGDRELWLVLVDHREPLAQHLRDLVALQGLDDRVGIVQLTTLFHSGLLSKVQGESIQYLLLGMGNTLQIINNTSVSPLSDLQFLKQVEIEHFGVVSVYLDPSLGIELFLKDYHFMYQGESKYRFLDNVKRINQNTPYLIKLHRLFESTQSPHQSCSKSNKISCLFQYNPITLKMMIENKKRKSLSFTEKQILWFLNCILKGEAQLNSHGNYHGDINPQFIYYNERTHHLTLFDSVFFDTTNAGYYRASQGKSYVSPEILTNLKEKRTFPNFNPFRSDVYSIGMVILYCMTLIDPISAYDYGRFEIDTYSIENLLRIAAKKYQVNVINAVRKMLGKVRPSSEEVIEELVRVGLVQQERERSAKSDYSSSTK